MLKCENVDVWGFKHAVRGMRNPLNSWDKSDSYIEVKEFSNAVFYDHYNVGEEDLQLMRKLYRAGTEHRKYLRQIFVSMDITAPLYWWKEFDTYKVGTVSNSCSTMHKIAAKPFELDDFSYEHLDTDTALLALQTVIDVLNFYRDKYLHSRQKSDWWQLIQLLPSSYNQKRTITMNYENAVAIIKQRTGHKLDEWTDLISELVELPYLVEIIS